MHILRDALVVFLSATLMLFFLALVSYHPADPSLFSYSYPQVEVQNLTGIWGAYLSSTLLYSLGLGAYVLFFLGLEMFRRVLLRKPIQTAHLAGSAVLFQVGLNPLFSHIKEFMFYDRFPLLTGGLLASYEQKLLTAYVGQMGAVIIFLSLAAMGLLLLFDTNVFSLGFRQITQGFSRLKKKPSFPQSPSQGPSVF